MNSITTPTPTQNNRKRRRVDHIAFSTAQNYEAALQDNNSQYNNDTFQGDGETFENDNDILRNHEHILHGDEVADGGPGKSYSDIFRKLDLIYHRLRVLVEGGPTSRNASEEETERPTLEMEVEILKASLGQLEEKAGFRYHFKTDCERSYKRRDRLYEHIRKECDLTEYSRKHKFLYDIIYKPFCFRCRKTFSQRRFTIHVRDIHGEECPSRLELFQDHLSSITQDCNPDAPEICHVDEHSQISVVDVVPTRAGESSPSFSSRVLEIAADTHSIQVQEQHTFNPSWILSDFTIPQEQHIFDPLWNHSDFGIPQEQSTCDVLSDFMMPKEHHTFIPVWTDSLVDLSSPLQTGNESYPQHLGVGFDDANIQGHSETNHDNNRLPGPRYESNDFQDASEVNSSPTDLSWTPRVNQAIIQGLRDNQQHSILGVSQTQTVLPQDLGAKSPNVIQELAAAKAEEATWQEVVCIRRRTQDLKRITRTGSRILSPIA